MISKIRMFLIFGFMLLSVTVLCYQQELSLGLISSYPLLLILVFMLVIAKIEIIEKLRKSTTVDCQVCDIVRAKLRILVRHTLQRYKYPPDMVPDAVELVLKQVEVLSNS